MKPVRWAVLILFSLAVMLVASVHAAQPAQPTSPVAVGSANSMSSTPRVVQGFGEIPLHFEANTGQTDGKVKFLSRGSGYTLFLTPTETVLTLRKSTNEPPKQGHLSEIKSGSATVVRMKLLGANAAPKITGENQLPGTSNYFLGNDSKQWRTNVPQYSKVRYREVYPGIDLIYYGNQRQLEYDLVVSPGADPNAIRLAFEGAKKLSLDAEGNLILHTQDSELVQRAPLVYQEVGGKRQNIAGRYLLGSKNEVAFELASYDSSRPLIIDPTFIYSTHIPGTNTVDVVATDAAGNAYIAGTTGSVDFPATGGGFQTAPSGGVDAFVMKLNPAGTAVVYATYLGGDDYDVVSGIAVDDAGGTYVIGLTNSTNFPVGAGAFQPVKHGRWGDSFVAKLNATGSALEYSTFLGTSESAGIGGIAVDGARHAAYVAGWATDIPTTPGAFQPDCRPGRYVTTCQNAFVAKLNPTGTALVYSTYLGVGGGVSKIALDADGNAYVIGATESNDFPTTPGAFQSSCPVDGLGNAYGYFITKLNPTGSDLVYSTRFCGAVPSDIAVDGSGHAYLIGQGGSPPLVNPLPGIAGQTPRPFVTKLAADGTALVYSTGLGGSWSQWEGCSNAEWYAAIAADYAGNAYVTGLTCFRDFPLVNPLQSSLSRDWSGDGFVAKLSPAGALLFSTYLGSEWVYNDQSIEGGRDIAVDPQGNVYVVGVSDGFYFPTINALYPDPSWGYGYKYVVKIGFADNTLAGTSTSPPPIDGVSLTFDSVAQSGTTGVTKQAFGGALEPVPPGFTFGQPPTYFDITTTAVFAGSIEVCISYADVDYGITVGIKLFHSENGVWNDITVPPVDTANKIVCGVVTSLSPFVILKAPMPPLRPEGLLAPLAALVPAGTPPLPDRAFKLGKTVPLKFKLFAGSTLVTQNEAPPPSLLGLQRVGEAPLQLDTLDLDAGGSSENSLLFHCEGGNWVYNLKTTSFAAGTYVVTIHMPDGGLFKAGFVLK